MTSEHRRVSFDDESLILVDHDDRPVGYASKDDCHRGSGLLHRAFSVFLFTPGGELLLQQRSAQKWLWPLFWSNSCCSHPRRGESLEEATVRRLDEELGVHAVLRPLFAFEYQARFGDAGSENELCHVYAGGLGEPVRANANELADWRLISAPELDRELERQGERFTPWLKLEWQRIRRDYPDLASLRDGQA
jgi:isopentenyl-diphosphate Delta-isomerase